MQKLNGTCNYIRFSFREVNSNNERVKNLLQYKKKHQIVINTQEKSKRT